MVTKKRASKPSLTDTKPKSSPVFLPTGLEGSDLKRNRLIGTILDFLILVANLIKAR